MTNTELVSLESNHIKLSIDQRRGTWSLIGQDHDWQIESASIRFDWRSGRDRFDLNPLISCAVEKCKHPVGSHFESFVGLRMHSTHCNQVCFTTEMLVSEQAPMLLIRVEVQNHSGAAILLEHVDYFAEGTNTRRHDSNRARTISLFPAASVDDLRFFGQGWQSWSYAGVLRPHDTFPRSRLGPLSAPMQLCWGRKHPNRPGKFISDFYGAIVDIEARAGLVLGFLSQTQAFGRLEVDLLHPAIVDGLSQDLELMRLPAGESFATDWACLLSFDLDCTNPFEGYTDLVARLHAVNELKEAVSGWCSWYYFGQDITSENILQQQDWLRINRDRIPLELFQIDDGYQENIGDWDQDNRRFSEPLRTHVEKLHANSFRAGSWIAPLIALPNSKLAREHPDWLLRSRHGSALNAGFGWGRLFNPLDGTHPSVKSAIHEWIVRVIDAWGFDYLKLDFLYAGALQGKRYDDTKTGAMVLRDVLSIIRSAAGDRTFLVGCGCPLGSGIGLVDSMRVSPDVSEDWNGRYKGISLLVDRDPGFPSAWNAIRNSYYRAHQHDSWWLNDPDCLLMRTEGSNLTNEEVRTLATVIALCGGVVIDSDLLTGLADDRVAALARLIPPINQRPIQPALFEPNGPQIIAHRFSGPIGDWTLAAFLNFDDDPREIKVGRDFIGIPSNHDIIGFEFWKQELRRFVGDFWELGKLAPHSVELWAMRCDSQEVGWLGDSIHVSQGCSVSGFEVTDRRLSAIIDAGRKGRERIWLKIPGDLNFVNCEGEHPEVIQLDKDIISLEVDLDYRTHLQVGWD